MGDKKSTTTTLSLEVKQPDKDDTKSVASKQPTIIEEDKSVASKQPTIKGEMQSVASKPSTIDDKKSIASKQPEIDAKMSMASKKSEIKDGEQSIVSQPADLEEKISMASKQSTIKDDKLSAVSKEPYGDDKKSMASKQSEMKDKPTVSQEDDKKSIDQSEGKDDKQSIDLKTPVPIEYKASMDSKLSEQKDLPIEAKDSEMDKESMASEMDKKSMASEMDKKSMASEMDKKSMASEMDKKSMALESMASEKKDDKQSEIDKSIGIKESETDKKSEKIAGSVCSASGSVCTRESEIDKPMDVKESETDKKSEKLASTVCSVSGSVCTKRSEIDKPMDIKESETDKKSMASEKKDDIQSEIDKPMDIKESETAKKSEKLGSVCSVGGTVCTKRSDSIVDAKDAEKDSERRSVGDTKEAERGSILSRRSEGSRMSKTASIKSPVKKDAVSLAEVQKVVSFDPNSVPEESAYSECNKITCSQAQCTETCELVDEETYIHETVGEPCLKIKCKSFSCTPVCVDDVQDKISVSEKSSVRSEIQEVPCNKFVCQDVPCSPVCAEAQSREKVSISQKSSVRSTGDQTSLIIGDKVSVISGDICEKDICNEMPCPKDCQGIIPEQKIISSVTTCGKLICGEVPCPKECQGIASLRTSVRSHGDQTIRDQISGRTDINEIQSETEQNIVCAKISCIKELCDQASCYRYCSQADKIPSVKPSTKSTGDSCENEVCQTTCHKTCGTTDIVEIRKEPSQRSSLKSSIDRRTICSGPPTAPCRRAVVTVAPSIRYPEEGRRNPCYVRCESACNTYYRTSFHGRDKGIGCAMIARDTAISAQLNDKETQCFCAIPAPNQNSVSAVNTAVGTSENENKGLQVCAAELIGARSEGPVCPLDCGLHPELHKECERALAMGSRYQPPVEPPVEPPCIQCKSPCDNCPVEGLNSKNVLGQGSPRANTPAPISSSERGTTCEEPRRRSLGLNTEISQLVSNLPSRTITVESTKCPVTQPAPSVDGPACVDTRLCAESIKRKNEQSTRGLLYDLAQHNYADSCGCSTCNICDDLGSTPTVRAENNENSEEKRRPMERMATYYQFDTRRPVSPHMITRPKTRKPQKSSLRKFMTTPGKSNDSSLTESQRTKKRINNLIYPDSQNFYPQPNPRKYLGYPEKMVIYSDGAQKFFMAQNEFYTLHGQESETGKSASSFGPKEFIVPDSNDAIYMCNLNNMSSYAVTNIEDFKANTDQDVKSPAYVQSDVLNKFTLGNRDKKIDNIRVRKIFRRKIVGMKRKESNFKKLCSSTWGTTRKTEKRGRVSKKKQVSSLECMGEASDETEENISSLQGSSKANWYTCNQKVPIIENDPYCSKIDSSLSSKLEFSSTYESSVFVETKKSENKSETVKNISENYFETSLEKHLENLKKHIQIESNIPLVPEKILSINTECIFSKLCDCMDCVHIRKQREDKKQAENPKIQISFSTQTERKESNQNQQKSDQQKPSESFVASLGESNVECQNAKDSNNQLKESPQLESSGKEAIPSPKVATKDQATDPDLDNISFKSLNKESLKDSCCQSDPNTCTCSSCMKRFENKPITKKLESLLEELKLGNNFVDVEPRLVLKSGVSEFEYNIKITTSDKNISTSNCKIVSNTEINSKPVVQNRKNKMKKSTSSCSSVRWKTKKLKRKSKLEGKRTDIKKKKRRTETQSLNSASSKLTNPGNPISKQALKAEPLRKKVKLDKYQNLQKLLKDNGLVSDKEKLRKQRSSLISVLSAIMDTKNEIDAHQILLDTLRGKKARKEKSDNSIEKLISSLRKDMNLSSSAIKITCSDLEIRRKESDKNYTQLEDVSHKRTSCSTQVNLITGIASTDKDTLIPIRPFPSQEELDEQYVNIKNYVDTTNMETQTDFKERIEKDNIFLRTSRKIIYHCPKFILNRCMRQKALNFKEWMEQQYKKENYIKQTESLRLTSGFSEVWSESAHRNSSIRKIIPVHFNSIEKLELARKVSSEKEFKIENRFSGSSKKPSLSSSSVKSSNTSTNSEDTCIGLLKAWLFETILDDYLDNEVLLTEYTKILDNWLTIIALHNLLNIISKQFEKNFNAKLETRSKASLLKHWFEAEGIEMLIDRIKNGCTKPTEDHFKLYLKKWLDNPEIRKMMEEEVQKILNPSSESIISNNKPENTIEDTNISVNTIQAFLNSRINMCDFTKPNHITFEESLVSMKTSMSSLIITSKEDITDKSSTRENLTKQMKRDYSFNDLPSVLTSNGGIRKESATSNSSNISDSEYKKRIFDRKSMKTGAEYSLSDLSSGDTLTSKEDFRKETSTSNCSNASSTEYEKRNFKDRQVIDEYSLSNLSFAHTSKEDYGTRNESSSSMSYKDSRFEDSQKIEYTSSLYLTKTDESNTSGISSKELKKSRRVSFEDEREVVQSLRSFQSSENKDLKKLTSNKYGKVPSQELKKSRRISFAEDAHSPKTLQVYSSESSV